MKKIITIVIFLMMLCTGVAYTQTLNLDITQVEEGAILSYCDNFYDSVRVSKDPTCNNGPIHWHVAYYPAGTFTNYYTDNVTIPFNNSYEYVEITYSGCNINEKWFAIFPLSFENVPEPWTEDTRWLNQGETLELEVNYSPTLNYLWPNGSNDWHYYITGPEMSGKVWIRMYNDCGELSDTINVYYGEGVYRATVDLETHLNKVTWTTTPKQTEYISEVKVYRDGMLVGTVPYEQGYFLDNIGSDNAARNYHLVSVTPNGEESPASAPKGTIHTTYYLDVNDNLNMTWNIPYGTQGSLTYFQICKYDSNTGDLIVVDQVNSSITDYTCGVNQFEGGYPVIAAVFNDDRNREFEDLSFSNMYTDIAIQPQEITISLEPGWTWFSYPYAVSKTLDEALFGFTPMSGDIIVSQSGGTTSFVNGRWRGALTQFTPGLGYMYYSSRSESAPLVFDLSSSRARVKP